MDLLTAYLPLPPPPLTSSDPDIAELLASRLAAIPAVQHIRTRPTPTRIGIGVFYLAEPEQRAAIEAAIRAAIAEIAGITRQFHAE